MLWRDVRGAARPGVLRVAGSADVVDGVGGEAERPKVADRQAVEELAVGEGGPARFIQGGPARLLDEVCQVRAVRADDEEVGAVGPGQVYAPQHARALPVAGRQVGKGHVDGPVHAVR
jgi:hypothetical protein